MTTSRGKKGTPSAPRGRENQGQVPENKRVTQEPRENREKHRARGSGLRQNSDASREVDDFLAYLTSLKRSRSTLDAYRRELRRFFDWLAAEQIGDVRAVARTDIEAYIAKMNAEAFKPESVHVMLRAVRRFYEYLERAGRVLVDPTEGIPWPKLGDRLPRDVLTAAEVRRLLNAPDTSKLKGVRDKAILEVLYSSGIRVGELCALTVYDIDLNAGYLRVEHGKGGRSRVVPLGRTACNYVRDYLKHVRSKWSEKQRDERALFISLTTGTSLQTSAIHPVIRDLARKARIVKRVTPHTLRHTCATHLVASGADIMHVQRLLGHADVKTTQIYTRVAPVDAKAEHERCHPSEKQDAPKTFKPVRKMRPHYQHKATS